LRAAASCVESSRPRRSATRSDPEHAAISTIRARVLPVCATRRCRWS